MKFDLLYITRRRKFKWPLIFYFASRYSLLLTMVGVIVAVNVKSPINCHTLLMVVELIGHASIGFACINFAIRTLAVWDNARWAIIMFVLVTLGHWSLILQTGIINAQPSSLGSCYIAEANNAVQIATLAYSMAFDLVSLILIAVKLPLRGSSIIRQLLRHDTLPYIFTATVLNCLATVFMCLNLNAVMGSIFVFPSAVCSSVMAAHCFRRVTDQSLASPDFYNPNSTVLFRRELYTDQTLTTTTLANTKRRSDGLHIQMQTFVTTDEVDDDVRSKPADQESQVLPSESDGEHHAL